jgi:hypothetical protein
MWLRPTAFAIGSANGTRIRPCQKIYGHPGSVGRHTSTIASESIEANSTRTHPLVALAKR